jgi:hypothetical protein
MSSGEMHFLGNKNPDVVMKRLAVFAVPNWHGKRAVLKNGFSIRKPSPARFEKLIAFVNRKSWWHVPPVDPDAYRKRGKLLGSSFEAAEFYGRPLDEPQRVVVAKPLIGDERTISKVLRIPPQHDGMTLKQVAAHDALWRNAALKNGFDSILLVAPKCFAKFKTTGKIPRSLELNILRVPYPSRLVEVDNRQRRLNPLWGSACPSVLLSCHIFSRCPVY